MQEILSIADFKVIILSYLSIAFGISAFVYATTVFFGRHLAKDKKENLSLWLYGAYEETWIHYFCSTFDSVFGKKHFSARCFLGSSILSVLTVVFLYFLFHEFLHVLGGRISDNISLWKVVLFGALINVIPDYISLYETRWLLKKFERVRTTYGQIILLIIDFLISGAIIWGGINLFGFTIGLGSSSLAEIVAIYSVYAIFFYSTFATSVWAWAYCISTWLMRVFSNTSIHRFLDIEADPVRQVSLVTSIILFLFSMLVIPLFDKEKNSNLSLIDDLLCDTLSGEMCAHAARISKDKNIALTYLDKACKEKNLDECLFEFGKIVEFSKTISSPTPLLDSFMWPVQGEIISSFVNSPDADLKNDGINIGAEFGTPVRASDDGEVIFSGDELQGSGKTILIRHSGNWVTAYAHNQINSVEVGEHVVRGQQIATVGNSGSVHRPQLHFEIRNVNGPIDPIPLLVNDVCYSIDIFEDDISLLSQYIKKNCASIDIEEEIVRYYENYTSHRSESDVVSIGENFSSRIQEIIVNDGMSNLPWPIFGPVISEFGPKPGGKNEGINISVRTSTKVVAVQDGVVIYVGDELKGYGNLIIIKHDNDWVTVYAHNSNLYVERGDQVVMGEIISEAGATGSVNSPQLHFEARKLNTPVNPLLLLSKDQRSPVSIRQRTE